MEPGASLSSSTSQILLAVFLSIFILLIIYPGIILVTFLSFISGYLFITYFDNYADKLHAWLGIKVDKKIKVEQHPEGKKIVLKDPLQQVQDEAEVKSNLTSTHLTIPATTSSSSPAFIPTPYKMPKIDDISLKIDPQLDASISRFVSTVFDYYVSPQWAPYHTRRQLKLSFSQLLTKLGENINSRLKENPKFLVDISTSKLIPLALHYLKRIQENYGLGQDAASLILPLERKSLEKLRVRKLCRIILMQCMPNGEEKRCKVWCELCIAVLSDGVFWNLFELGKDQLPEVITAQIKAFQSEENISFNFFNMMNENADSKNETRPPSSSVDSTDNSSSIPFLLDNFLDRKDSLEQPDPIHSRWRPTLKEIVEETEMLYPLIQYLKHVGGQKALAYLQAVLDDSPDAKDHCRRVLEVEYLPGFCRSNYFHESLGLSRVEQGTEVVTEGSPSLSRRLTKVHSRSASYGSKNNFGELLRIEGGVVDGLPLYSSEGPSSISSSASGGFGAEEVVDSIFKKKPQMEDLIAKFLKSISKNSDSTKSPENSPTKRTQTMRVGIDAKSYKKWKDKEVAKRVQIEKCDIFGTTTEIVTSTLSGNASFYLSPIISSWLQFLDPYIQPHFSTKLEAELKSLLNLQLLIKSVDWITEAFISSGQEAESTAETKSQNKDIPVYNSSYNKEKEKPVEIVQENENGSSAKTTEALLMNIFISKILNIDKFLNSLSINRDYIFLFFVDVLDLLVYELFGHCCDIETTNEK